MARTRSKGGERSPCLGAAGVVPHDGDLASADAERGRERGDPAVDGPCPTWRPPDHLNGRHERVLGGWAEDHHALYERRVVGHRVWGGVSCVRERVSDD